MRLLLLLLLLPFGAVAQPSGVQSCAFCHGAQGEGNATNGTPRIAGQPQTYLERQLAAYADGRRDSEVMTPIARQLAPEQRTALSVYYSGLRTAPARAARAPAANARGFVLATRGDPALKVQACQDCHGPGGTGFGNVNPYLAGLDQRYLEAALHEWKSGSRKTDSSQQMSQIAGNLGDADIKALAAYFSTQPPPLRTTTPAQKPPGNEPSGSQGAGGAGSK
jgi:cytochrome c553